MMFNKISMKRKHLIFNLFLLMMILVSTCFCLISYLEYPLPSTLVFLGINIGLFAELALYTPLEYSSDKLFETQDQIIKKQQKLISSVYKVVFEKEPKKEENKKKENKKGDEKRNKKI